MSPTLKEIEGKGISVGDRVRIGIRDTDKGLIVERLEKQVAEHLDHIFFFPAGSSLVSVDGRIVRDLFRPDGLKFYGIKARFESQTGKFFCRWQMAVTGSARFSYQKTFLAPAYGFVIKCNFHVW